MLQLSSLRTRQRPTVLPSTVVSSIYNARHFAYSLWLFTVSDLKTIVGPSTAFGILQALGGPSLGVDLSDPSASSIFAPRRLLAVICWTWINLLAFTMDNQRQLDAIEEDRCNKPWRPLPSKRMTPAQATKVIWFLYPLTVLVSIPVGTVPQSLSLVALGLWHNCFGGGDTSWIIRNFLNACGFTCYLSGALQILLQQPVFSTPKLCGWFLTIACIVFSTIHTQDMYDQEGDSQRGRRTAPLVLGDYFARWTIAVPTLFWSWFCPYFWSVSLIGYVAPLVLGGLVTSRTLTKKTVAQDRTTFKLWNLWLVVLYSLPMVQTWFM